MYFHFDIYFMNFISYHIKFYLDYLVIHSFIVFVSIVDDLHQTILTEEGSINHVQSVPTVPGSFKTSISQAEREIGGRWSRYD